MQKSRRVHIIVDDSFSEAEHDVLSELKQLARAPALSARPEGLEVSLRFLSELSPADEVASSPSPAMWMNLAISESEGDGFLVLLSLGEFVDLQSVASLIFDYQAENFGVCIGRSKLSLVSLGASGVSLADRVPIRNPASACPALHLRLNPPQTLCSIIINRSIIPTADLRFDTDLMFAKARNEFFLRLATRDDVLVKPDLFLSEKVVVCKTGTLEQRHRDILSEEFNYGSKPYRSSDRLINERHVSVKVSELNELLSETGSAELFAPFERPFRKLLVLAFRLVPSLYFLAFSLMRKQQPRIVRAAKSALDFVQSILGLPRAARAGILLLLHKARVKSLAEVPVFINNRNRLEMMTDLIRFLEDSGFLNIIIIDNASSYPPLLKFYASSKHKIVRLKKNVGPLAIWSDELKGILPRGFYIYTDSDVVPSFRPGFVFLEKALFGFIVFPFLKKIGLSLKIDNLPAHFSARLKVIEHEKKYWEATRPFGFYDAPVDTTFALYGPGVKGGFWVRAFRMAPPWTAEHRPWYIDDSNPTENEKYYVRTAGSWASWKLLQ